MEIITRRQAIDRKLTRYYSGIPCKRGHLSERYTINMACIECVKPSFGKENREQRWHENYMRKLSLNRMGKLKLAVFTPNLQQIREMAYALSVAREPLLRPGDCLAHCEPQYRGPNMFLHAFKLFPEDFEVLTAYNNSLTGY